MARTTDLLLAAIFCGVMATLATNAPFTTLDEYHWHFLAQVFFVAAIGAGLYGWWNGEEN